MRNDFRGYTVTSSGIAVSSGIYFYRFETGEFVKTKKMVLVR